MTAIVRLGGVLLDGDDPHFLAGFWADHQAPETTVPKQIHLELAVTDLDAVEARAVELGAVKSRTQPNPDVWRVLQDPAGHPFCLTTMIPEV